MTNIEELKKEIIDIFDAHENLWTASIHLNSVIEFIVARIEAAEKAKVEEVIECIEELEQIGVESTHKLAYHLRNKFLNNPE